MTGPAGDPSGALAGDPSGALAWRDALIGLDGDVWTAHRGGQPVKADCHSALAARRPALSGLAPRRGSHLRHAASLCTRPCKRWLYLSIVKPVVFCVPCRRSRVFHFERRAGKRQARHSLVDELKRCRAQGGHTLCSSCNVTVEEFCCRASHGFFAA